jgi:hypothetical protein
MIRTISELKEKNKAIGNYFFSKNTMKFFNSKIESAILKSKYFITSEDNWDGSKREFTIREFKETGEIINNPFDRRFSNKIAAKEFLKDK